MERLSRRLKRILKATSPLSRDADRTPDALAFQDFILEFPFPTQIMLVEAGTDSATTMKRTFTLVRFDLAQPKSSAANFHGSVSAVDAAGSSEVLGKYFGVQHIGLIQRLNAFNAVETAGSYFTQFVPFNISKDIDRYALQLFGFLADGFTPYVQKRYRGRHTVDFNERYHLPPDPILSKEELLRPHPFSESMVHVPSGQSLTVEDWQSDVADIQLIPQVPADVKSTFDTAKQLYVFGYFQWRFFTVALHYACLAMEAAVKHRWIASLPEKVIVEYSNSACCEIVRPTHRLLYTHWRKDRNITVNGKGFPDSMPDLLHSLKQKKIIAPWQEKQIQDCIDERNDLSHLEMATVHTPRPNLLRDVAELTNAMFEGVAQAEGAAVLSGLGEDHHREPSDSSPGDVASAAQSRTQSETGQ